MSDLWAHSKNARGVRHPLVAHLRGTAGLAGSFAAVFGAECIAYYLALVHDAGKARLVWQQGLLRAEASGGRVVGVDGQSIDHKRAGTWLAAQHIRPPVFAMVVWGHHGGLSDLLLLKDAVRQEVRGERDAVQEAVGAVAAIVPEVQRGSPVPVPEWVLRDENREAIELLVRLVFSAVVDADVLDTRGHYAEQTEPQAVSLASLVEVFEANRVEYLAEQAAACGVSPVDGVRSRVYEQAVAAGVAAGEAALFPFAAPTGAGKTIAVAGLGVHHARARGGSRLIVAVPFTSITGQNARVYRRLFGAEHVLEHHSGVDVDALPEGERRRHRLGAENWMSRWW
ncbi:CRISPR-associated endonuclease/helicase Cas3 [Nocardia transvalensis]|uniref:CRISPR-associated endonuclease/helicase Cas3 n=1 Tax=Nocardia transvalensis TaxID=37333 RepID=A0A7W9UFJ2_9NOCA|nr:CRISPR-associated endonuclease Cas3'' [Nocardia transvalensis]MBB5911268.1 CRISPR-associated endonuclease/helicase Cas3 [Nocardia transvalensis]